MVGRVSLGLAAVVALLALAGCGEQASKEDMIDAPTVSTSQTDSSKARGVSDAEIARQNAMDHAAPGGNRK